MANDVEDRAGGRTGGAPPRAASAPADPAPAARKRGRETAADMVRTLAVIMVLVVPMWFLAQPPDSDEQRLRVVDPTADFAAFGAEVPQAPVPAALPDAWRPTSSSLGRDPDALRVGYVTPAGDYAELAASTAPVEEYLPEIVGEGATSLEAVEIDGQPWEQYVDADGSLSLVRAYDSVLVVVGSLRSSADLSELRALATSLEER